MLQALVNKTLLSDIQPSINSLAQDRGFQVEFQEERARKVFAEQYGHLYGSFEELLRTDALGYQLSLAEAFRDDAAEAKANPETIYIADRTGFDVACYTMLLSGNGEADAKKINMIFSLLHDSLHIVDHVFLTMPFGGIAEQDGFRPSHYEDPAKRAMEENLFRHIGVLFPNTTVLPSDRHERVKVVLDKISLLIPAP